MNTFPGQVLEALHLRVVRDVAASRTFYLDVLGATLLRTEGDFLAFLDLAGTRIVLSSAGGPTADKPTVTFAPPTDPDLVSTELVLRVADVRATHRALTERGAVFLTDPVEFPWETRCFLRDPDGHLLELTQPPPATSTG